MDYDVLDGVPCHVLGRVVKTKTQIVLSILLPACLELLVYLFLTAADIAVTYQHFYDGHPGFAALTLMFLFLPAIVCFCSIITSAWQWPDEAECSRANWKFFGVQFFNLILFPIGASYRYSRRIFWSIEALFHEKTKSERCQAVSKAFENSPFELYHFCQAFFQAAPQIILQLYVMLRENMFRNYETTTAQIISLVFSFVTMGIIIASYQRFESQKCVGRNYPWCSKEQVSYRVQNMRQTKRLVSEIRAPATPVREYTNLFSDFNLRYNDLSRDNNQTESFRDTFSNIDNLTPILGDSPRRKTLNVSPNNFDDNMSKISPTLETEFPYDELDSEPRRITTKRVSYNIPQARPNTDLMENIDEIRSYIDQIDGPAARESPVLIRRSYDPENYDSVPATPAPPTPHTTEYNIFNIGDNFRRISVFKDMLVQNTNQYIKDHVPRLPQKFFEHDEDIKKAHTEPHAQKDDELKPLYVPTVASMPPEAAAADETDLALPTRRAMIEGIEQDDFIAKVFSFIGWGMFLLMRMLSLSVFSVFYLAPCLYIISGHYFVMVVCLVWETKFQEKSERMAFYLFLGIIYIFSILEFKIKFKHLRQWYIGYISFVFAQNIVITLVWHAQAEYSSWWYHYLFAIIIGSGVLSIGSLLFYYILLKPQDKVMLEK